MPNLARKRLARELVRAITEQPERQSDLLRQTAAYLIESKQAHQAHLLVHDIADELLAQQSHLSAEVRSAFGLNDTTRQKLIEVLQAATGAHTVELDEKTDPSLIGGLVVRTSQLELDTSIKRQLTQLAGGTT